MESVSTCGDEEAPMGSSASHTAAPSVVNDHHDDPASLATDHATNPSSAQRNSTRNTRTTAKTRGHVQQRNSAHRLPAVAAPRRGHTSTAAPVSQCEVVFSPPGSPQASSLFGTSGAGSAGVAPVGSASTAALASANTQQQPGEATRAARVHRVNHPHGFRILKDTSAIERSMKTYFRLPPAPNARLQQERQKIHKELLRVEQAESRELRHVANGGGVLLDGFLLLSAAGVEDPDEVEAVTLQSSHLVGSVAEDLAYFQSLFFLDASENELHLEDLLPLEGLETLHLAYNRLSSLTGLEAYIQTEQQQQEEQWCGASSSSAGAADPAHLNLNETNGLGGTATSKSSVLHGVLLPCLQALNLSYNTLPYTELPYLSYFPCLEKLDLSGNNLRRLPADLSLLASVTHLAVENNNFSSGGENDVFLALSSMPSLQEVNLNNNGITSIPLLSVQDGRGLCFPCIETIGLSENKFRRAEALLPLASLHRSLRRVVLSKNPISTDTVHTRRTRQLFDQAIVDAYYERVFLASSDRPTHGYPTNDAVTASPASPASPPPPAPGVAAAGDPNNDDDALWKGQSWSRFIPSSADNQGEGERAGMADPTPPMSSGHSATTTSRAAVVGAQTTELLTAEEYFYQYRIELVFDEFKMPKQPLRHFYSTGLREGGQNTLVTIPDYKEFMDIYRITGRKKTSWKSKLPGPHARGATKKPAHGLASRPIATPPASEPDAQEEEEEEEEEDPAVPLSDAEPPLNEPAPHTVTVSEDVTFFMTEMDDDGTGAVATPKPPSAPRKTSAKAVESLGQHPTGDGQRRLAPRAAAADVARDATGERRTARPDRLPASVVSPASSNVHTAMHELRAILRKPLPPLPYGVNGGKAATRQDGNGD